MFLLDIANVVTMVKAIRMDNNKITFLTRKEGSKTGNFTIELPPNTLDINVKYTKFMEVLNNQLKRERMRKDNLDLDNVYYGNYVHGEQNGFRLRMAVDYKNFVKELTEAFSTILTYDMVGRSDLKVSGFNYYEPVPPKADDPILDGLFYYQVIDNVLVIEQLCIKEIVGKANEVEGYEFKSLLTNGYNLKIGFDKKGDIAEQKENLRMYFYKINELVRVRKDSQIVPFYSILTLVRGMNYKVQVKGWEL